MAEQPDIERVHPSEKQDDWERILARPAEQRLREYRYRCAQALVFGIPVLGLAWFGRSLGGTAEESARWRGLLEGALSGWVMYVGAMGMLFEGIVLLRRGGPRGDLFASALALAIFLYSAIAVGGVIVAGRPVLGEPRFDAAVLVVIGWTGWRWHRGAA